MRKFLLMAAIAGIAVVSMTGCSVFEGIGQSYHESNASFYDIEAPIDKVAASVEKSLPKLGLIASRSKDTILEKEFEGDGVDVTVKKIDDKKARVYIRIGIAGDTVKEGALFSEIQKNL